MNNSKIAVFDSGVGGLTVLKTLKEMFPKESFIFVGDNKHSPYGEKTTEQLWEYSCEIIDFFLTQDVKLIVLACNTTSCAVLPRLKEAYTIPMLGVVDATIQYYKQHPSHHVCVMATPMTIAQGVYQSQLDHCIGLACPSLVPLIEGHLPVEDALRGYLDDIKDTCDGVILGCTHYPIVQKQIEMLYPKFRLYSSSDAVCLDVAHFLETHDLAATKKQAMDIVYTTGDVKAFLNASQHFFDYQGVKLDKLELTHENSSNVR